MNFAFRSVLAVALAAMVGGCSVESSLGPQDPAVNAKVYTPAAELRKTLDSLLQEHVVLAAQATNAAISGRNDEYKVARGQLDANTQELADLIGQVYGKLYRQRFVDIWQRQVGALADYAAALSPTQDPAKRDAAKLAAVNELVQFTQDFGAYIEDVSKGKLLKEGMADTMSQHVRYLKDICDAQAAKEYDVEYRRERDAQKQIMATGDVLASTIVDEFPQSY